MALFARSQSWRIEVTRLVISPEEYFQKNDVSSVNIRAITACWRVTESTSLTLITSLFLITSIMAHPTTTPPKRAATGYRSLMIPLGMTLLKISLLINGTNMPIRLAKKAVRITAKAADQGILAMAKSSSSLPFNRLGGSA